MKGSLEKALDIKKLLGLSFGVWWLDMGLNLIKPNLINFRFMSFKLPKYIRFCILKLNCSNFNQFYHVVS
ncbi:hypothetical protein DKK76_10570 [Frischella perrara]|uniref:Uncharacterized protein n=1 Tax=Frischella perrara TaxID=1267021 RepID=A0A318MT51_FRIPE|nr:hypothetical protein DKK76_10570 [Frischella perrara]